MSSGFGIRGGIGRCYPFYAELKECLVVSDLTTRNITTESGRALSKLASSNGTGKVEIMFLFYPYNFHPFINLAQVATSFTNIVHSDSISQQYDL
jgi:hypothetical protein